MSARPSRIPNARRRHRKSPTNPTPNHKTPRTPVPTADPVGADPRVRPPLTCPKAPSSPLTHALFPHFPRNIPSPPDVYISGIENKYGEAPSPPQPSPDPKGPTMTNVTRSPKFTSNRAKTGLFGAPSRAKQTQFPKSQSCDKRLMKRGLGKKRLLSPPSKQTQTNPIAAGVLIVADEVALSAAPAESNGPVERISRSPRPHLNSQISDLKSAAPSACPVIIRAKQTQFPQPEIEAKSLPNRGLRRIPPQTTREKQTQSNPIAAGVLIQPLARSAAPAESNGAVERISCPPRPAVPGSPPGPCPEQPGVRIDRMLLETHTTGSFCTDPGAAPDDPTCNLGSGRVPASLARPGEGGSKDWDRS